MHVRKDGLTATYLVRSFRDRERAADIRRTAAVHHAVVHDEVPDRAEGVVQRALRLVDDLCGMGASARRVSSGYSATYHLVAAPDEDRHCPRVRTLLDDQHLVSCGPKRHFANDARLAELLCR